MSKKASCAICSSADQRLEKFIEGVAVETAHHRMGSQQLKCGFGLQGVCCRLCANGPCRVTPNAPRGVCGADADTIVARNFLREIAAGSGCYIHIVENTALNLKKIAQHKGEIKGEKTLNHLAEVFEVKAKDKHEKALAVANLVLADLYKPRYEKMELVKKLALDKRLNVWEKLDILPGGAKAEVFDAIVKTSTNLNSDPVNMLLHGLTLGISTGIYGLMLTNLLNDIMLGEAKIMPVSVGFKVVDPDYINIMITGHQHSKFTYLQEALISNEIKERAKKAGAKGFKIVGCTCVGQDLQLRNTHYTEVFAGHAGNNFTSEALIATGGIDLVVSEFNCTFPGIEPIADTMMVKMICVDDVAKKKNAQSLPLCYDNQEEVAEKIIAAALESYNDRRGKVTINIPKDHGNDDTIAGVTEVSLKEFLGGTFKPLLDLIAEGKIKGVAGIVGCSSLIHGHDVLTVELTKELIKRDIIVLSAGCSSGGLENVGLMSPSAADLAGDNLKGVCKSLGIPPVLNFGPCLAIGRLEMVAVELAKALNVDLPALPLVTSAPQWLEEQALADGCFALSLGLTLHLGKAPNITGSPLAVKVLTEDLLNLTGGQVIIDDNAKTAADKLEAIIMKKRGQ